MATLLASLRIADEQLTGAFDHAFAPANNPWRHLGALTFLCLVIAVASGIVACALHDTSVSGAYDSGRRLQNDPLLLARNFLTPGALNDRFFSLIMFIHIGVPLLLLAAVWVHVQRVSLPRMWPPSFIQYAMRMGAAGTVIAGCRKADCEYRLGDQWLQERFRGARKPGLRAAVPRNRIAVVWSGRDIDRVRAVIATLRAGIRSARTVAATTILKEVLHD